jgi:DNA-binding SARP family transcriptional activator
VDSFHTALYRIRRAVGANAIVTEGGQYRLGDVDYWFDVREFEALIERARLLPPHDVQAENLWQRAVALYRGDLLPEVERVWCVPRREALRDMMIEALSGIGQHHAARGNFEEALGWYKHALQMDELREDLHRHVMRCYAEAGRRAEALAQYRRCQEILERELSVEPSPETQALYKHIAGKKPG